jgi:hypothetical protein
LQPEQIIPGVWLLCYFCFLMVLILQIFLLKLVKGVPLR